MAWKCWKCLVKFDKAPRNATAETYKCTDCGMLFKSASNGDTASMYVDEHTARSWQLVEEDRAEVER